MNDSIENAIVSDKLQTVYSAWKILCAGRVGPRRAEVLPSRLGRAVSWTFMVDVLDGARDFRFGFAGDKLMQFLGARCAAPTMAGMRGDYFFDKADELFRHCVASGKPVLSGPMPTRYRGKEHLERQVLLMPLSEDGAIVTGLIGAFDTWQLGTHEPQLETVSAD